MFRQKKKRNGKKRLQNIKCVGDMIHLQNNEYIAT